MDAASHPSGRTTRSQWAAGLLGAVALALAACAANLVLPERARQGWWDERGPVVPHETFPSDCSLCHVGPGWRTIRDDFEFDHAAETGVPLEGAHAAAECLRCHNDRGPVAWFSAQGCGGCHVDPHVGRLGPDCATCHEQLDWRPSGALADHQRTRFPLLGAHLTTACSLCHPGADAGRFTGVSTSCASCHLDDALGAQSFDHAASGNLTACDQCHQPTGWSGGAFVHAFFPLTGDHAGFDCTDCHTTASFPTFSCTHCHDHSLRAMGDKHDDVPGYTWSSPSCYACHPNGQQ